MSARDLTDQDLDIHLANFTKRLEETRVAPPTRQRTFLIDMLEHDVRALQAEKARRARATRAERFRHTPREEVSCPCGAPDEPKETQTPNGSWKFRCGACGRQSQTFVRKYDARTDWATLVTKGTP